MGFVLDIFDVQIRDASELFFLAPRKPFGKKELMERIRFQLQISRKEREQCWSDSLMRLKVGARPTPVRPPAWDLAVDVA